MSIFTVLKETNNTNNKKDKSNENSKYGNRYIV